MNRIDELTDRLTDGTLADAEAVELDAHLVADSAAQVRHLAAVRLELVLRGLRTDFDLAGATVTLIEASRVERTTAAVMAELATTPVPGRPTRRFRRWGAFATAATILVAVWVGLWSTAPLPIFRPAPREVAVLTAVSGSVEVIGPMGATAARPNQAVTPDLTLRTVGEESAAVVEFLDRSRVEIHPESVVRFGPAGDGGPYPRLVLIEGSLTTVATGRRVVVGAGTTEVQVSQGSFSLSSVGSGSARVEPTDGDVWVRGGAPAEPVRLEPGRAAFVRDEREPMRIDASWRIDSEPRARLDFQALDVGFTPAGELLAVSAKQWVKWVPGGPDPGRTPFPPKVFNDGLAAWLTADRDAVALCRVDDRTERISVRNLPTGGERGQIPVRVSEPRFLCVAPDGSWVATVGRKPDNRRVRLWEVASGQERSAFDFEAALPCLSTSPDGRTLAVGMSDSGKGAENGIVLIDVTTGERHAPLLTRRKALTALAFSADGKRLAAGFNGVVQIWDLPGRKLLRTLEGFERSVTRIVFDTRGQSLAAGMGDGQVWVWSTATGRRTQVIEAGTRGVRSLGFSPDGKSLVTATNNAGVAVWEVAPEPADGARDF